jgi:hypothetical protein
MRVSPVMRGACAAAAFVFSFSLTPSFARMGASMGRPVGGGHFAHFAPHGFNGRFGFAHSGFNRFGSIRFGYFAPDRFKHFGFGRFGRNQFGFVGWDGWSGALPAPVGALEPIIVEGGAPVVINIDVDPGPGGAGSALRGGCVIHKLNYDNAGKYVGERQIPQC